jgi:two-component system sensor histidine kinase QseC
MSLRLRLVVIIGLALIVLWSAAAAWILHDLDQNLQRTLDNRLAMSARMVSGLLSQRVDLARAGAAIRKPEVLTVPGGRGMACQIRSMRGKVVATTRGVSNALSAGTKPGYHTRTIDGRQWRTFTLRADGLSITTADRIDGRDLLRRKIAAAAGIPFLIAAVGGLLALWFGTTRGLAPLGRLRRELAHRQPDALSPLTQTHLPAELQPLVRTLNSLLHRVAQAMRRERHFTNDAAHELRTPLTAVSTHLQVARITTGKESRAALADAAAGVGGLRATLDQLLLLARVEGQLPFDDDDCIDAGETLSRAIADSGTDAASRVTRGGEGKSAILAVPPALAVVALRNLIANGLRYSPEDSRVDVSIDADERRILFSVVDRGKGLEPDDYARAKQRFWRARQGGGSGLGLTIVDAIARRYGGDLKLLANSDSGVTARLELPRLAGRCLSAAYSGIGAH